jgi:hypothetical protein
MSNVIATSLEVLFVPGCCKKLYFGCYYEVPDSRTLLKRGLSLVCPNCSKGFSTSRPLFDVLGPLNIALIDTNNTLDNVKKSGFLLVVELPSELHTYILTIVKPYLDLGLSPSDRFDVGLAVGILGSSGQGGYRSRIEFPHRGFCLTRVMFNCRTCGNIIPSNVFSNRSGRITCNDCDNRQRFPKRRLAEVQKHVSAFNVAVAACLRQGLLVVPVPQGWKPDIL